MKDFSGYSLIEKINDSGKSLIYRARKGDEKSVVLKILKALKPTLSDIARFQHEYNILKNLEYEGIVRTFDIIHHQDNVAIVLEDFNGEPLTKIAGDPWLTLERFLSLAIQLADTLGLLHRHNIVHKDIKPQNILVNRDNEIAKITDFGISSEITGSNTELYNPGYVQGTLSYISPEQSGRMNRPVDYRSDLYSLGVTFYEMLTGAPPFISKDPLELIHAHMAITPAAPREKDPAIPEVLSDIIMKLLSKTAEYRYQSSFGLKADLERCLEMVRKNGTIDNFDIGRNDISDRFNIPQKLYGREKEVDAMMKNFNEAAAGERRLMLVAGFPGIGKSALVHEIQKPVVQKRGYFIFGKYDQFKKDVPYSGFIQALQNLIRQILTESDEMIEAWRLNLMKKLGDLGRIIIDAIPEVELIIGVQPEVPDVGPEESQNRFFRVFKNFVSVFAQKNHPIALFLDDLQWVDNASLHILREIMIESEIGYLFIIGSYRDNEIGSAHLLRSLLDDLERNKIRLSAVTIGPISLDHVIDLVSESLKCPLEKSTALARLVYEKTRGNPFFVIQFIKSLYDDRMIKHDQEFGWQWDIDAIKEMQVTENVVELMAAKIMRLKKETRDVLKIAACIGNRFRLETIAIVMEKPVNELLFDLSEALEEGLVHFSVDVYRFLHDRIHEAVYSLIPDDEKLRLHYMIGKHVLNETAESDLVDKIFYIVNQLNKGIGILSGDEDRDELISLNIIAGKKAKHSTAYASSAMYFETAFSLMDEEAWDNDYERAYNISMEIAACEHLERNFEKAESVFTLLMERARTDIDRAGVSNLRMLMAATLGRHSETVDMGLGALELLGIKISKKVSQLDIARSLVYTKIILSRHSDETLSQLNELTDPKIEMVMKIMMNVTWSAYFFNPELALLMAMKMIKLTLKYGKSRISAYCYILYSMLLIVVKDYRNSIKFGDLSLAMNEQYNNAEITSKLYLYRSASEIWVSHAVESLKFTKKSLETAFEHGDLNNAIYAIQGLLVYDVFMGTNLDEITGTCSEYFDFIKRSKDPGALNYILSVRQFARCLKGETVGDRSMDDDSFSERSHIERMISDDIRIILSRHYILKLQLLYIMGDYENALGAVRESEKYLEYSIGMIVVMEHHFFHALTLAALWESADSGTGRKYLGQIKKSRNKLKKNSRFAPENFLHKLYLLDAELARIGGREIEAIDFYDKAIKSAAENNFQNCEAIACERAGLFYQSRGRVRSARAYLLDARYCYLRWGAHGKVIALEDMHEDLLIVSYGSGGAGNIYETMMASTGTSTTSTSEALDLNTVVKASQAISGEIHLEMLLEKLMMIVVENAGAQRGILVLEKEGGFFIEAVKDVSGGDVRTLCSIPVKESDELSPSILNYVERTGEYVVLADAQQDGTFSSDEYIMDKKPKSVLCVPIVHQGKLTGMFYLENNLTAGAFTRDRIEILQILSSQIAISIDNARLYWNLELMVKERTEQLSRTLDEVRKLKEQQDGDYFLTSLLIEPLCGNYAESDSVTIEFYIKEKKEFQFRKWKREIGGDINISYNIKLMGKTFPVFINADAMGKSVQGAGGALVLGSVFKSIIERTNLSPALQDQGPEQWILNVFTELQNVFESFDCSMMLSMVLGMIDTESSILYLINIEHPFTVLFRNGKADFIEKEMMSRRFGIPGLKAPERVLTMNLEDGDIIIAGTDGRDDLLLSKSGDGSRVFNEDDSLFLRCVEDGKGDLDRIFQGITDTGELTDDLSLLKIAYKKKK